MNPLANNKETMKQENRRQALSLIHRHIISRSGLAKETGLTQSAISSIMNELIKSGLVCEIGKTDDNSSLGRKPIMLDIVASWKTIVGISIDHEGFDIGLVDMKGNVFGEIVHFPYQEPPSFVLDLIADTVCRLIAQEKIPDSKILGVGAIAPGPVDAEGGHILNPPRFESWHHLNLRDELRCRLPYRVYVQHNSNALARAESSMGAGLKYNSFALLVINDGIGLGLVLDRKVYSGANGLGCEIGHTSVDINGRPCSCGNRGCLELYASTNAILYDAGRTRPDITTWERLVDGAYEGDSFSNSLLDLQAKYLAHSIINLNNLLELEAVILTGMAAYRGELLLEKLRAHVQQSVLSKSNRSLAFELSSIRENSMIVAASTAITDALFHGELYWQVGEEETYPTL